LFPRVKPLKPVKKKSSLKKTLLFGIIGLAVIALIVLVIIPLFDSGPHQAEAIRAAAAFL